MVTYKEVRSNFILKTNQITEDNLLLLKECFKNDINSNRRLEGISNIEDLLNILEKRYVLHESDTSCLNKIAVMLNNLAPGVGYNTYKPVTAQIQHADTNDVRHLNSDIFELIKTEIGSKWKDLARELSIREAQIDDLENKYMSISERVHHILLTYERRHHNDVFPLLNALSKCRRNDLRKEVQVILGHRM